MPGWIISLNYHFNIERKRILSCILVINYSPQVEGEVELVQKIVSVVRSTRADYNIPNKTKTELHLEITCNTTRDTLRRYTGCVATLAYCSAVTIADTPPSGCAIVTVNDKVRETNEIFSFAVKYFQYFRCAPTSCSRG